MRNTGGTTWTTAGWYNLGSQNPQDNFTWGMARVGLPGSVAPNSEVTFNFNVTAPSTPGTYNFQWRMVQDAVEWFGDFTTNATVSVGASPLSDAASFVSQSVPSSMTAGASYQVSMTMTNTGTSCWTAPTWFNLGSQNPQDNFTWGFARVAVPTTTAPGQQVTFNFTVVAPSAPGTYNFQWRMVHDGVTWFGDY